MINATQQARNIVGGGITEIPSGIIASLNDFLNSIFPEGKLWIILLFSIALAWHVKKRCNWGILPFAFLSIVFWSAFRFWGLGG